MEEASILKAADPMSEKRWLKLRAYFGKIVTLAQISCDAIVVFSSYLGSYWFYVYFLGKPAPQKFYSFLYISAGAALLYVLIMDRIGLYRREISLLNVKEMRGVFKTGIYAAAVILSSSFYIRSIQLSRLTITIAIVLAPMMLYLERQIFYRLHVLFHQKGWSYTKVVIYGAGNIGKHLAKRMFQSPTLGFFPIGFLDDNVAKHNKAIHWAEGGPKKGVPVLGGEDLLEDERLLQEVDLVVIALPSASFERNQKLVEHCVTQGIHYAIVPNAYEKFIQQVELLEIGGIPLIRRRAMRVSWLYLIAKRLVDLLIGAATIVVLSPLILILGFAIRLDSKGPVIFKQKRIGLRGKEFTFYKFRTMYTDAPKYAVSPDSKTDPRVTKVGRWLRRTSFDELPQLFNVFRGDMSLVGPRPEMPFIVSGYGPLERKRLEAKPGITGVWQISAVRGEPIHANLEYDLFYLENRSLLLDFAILVKTFLSVIRGIGAT